MGTLSVAVQPTPRSSSAARVFDSLWEAEVVTVTELMTATGLARVTVHAACNDLVGSGWVRELDGADVASAHVGRPARRFTLDVQAGYVLGVDVGDATVNVALADLHGVTVVKRSRGSRGSSISPARRVREVMTTVRATLREAGLTLDDVLAAGVGLAAPVSADGRVAFGRADGNAYWDSFRMADQLRRALAPVPTLVANDANLAALAERWRGAARGVDTFVTLLAGNRLGAGIVDAGRLLHGSAGGAGEMHFLDQMYAGHGADGLAVLAQRWAVEALDAGPAALATMAGQRPDAVTAQTVFMAAAAGDAVALAVLDRVADRFARVIAILGSLLNPELVVIGGAVADAADVLIGPITARLAALTFTPPRVACSTFGDTIVTVGAVRLALDHVRQTALERPLRGRPVAPASVAGGL